MATTAAECRHVLAVQLSQYSVRHVRTSRIRVQVLQWMQQPSRVLHAVELGALYGAAAAAIPAVAAAATAADPADRAAPAAHATWLGVQQHLLFCNLE